VSLDLSRYLDLYVAESREHLTAAREIAAGIAGASEAVLLELYRHAHSLKGMAASMGYTRVVEVAHAAEDLLEAIRRGRVEPATAAADLLLDALTCIACMVERAGRGETPDDLAVDDCVRHLRRAAAGAPGPRAEGAPLAATVPRRAPEARSWRMDFVLDETGAGARRVGALLSALGALGTIRTATAPSTSRGVTRLMVLLDSTASREALVTGLAGLPGVSSFVVRREVEDDAPASAATPGGGWARVPVAALTALATTAQDLLLDESLEKSFEESRGGRPGALRRRLLARMHAQATALRLEPFDSVAHRVVVAGRRAGAELGRSVRIEIEGGDVRLERSLLDALMEPLLHVVRNAVDHGVEPPAERRRLGKPPEGLVRLSLESAGWDTRICVEDDGRGLDPEALRQAAVRLGAYSADDAARLSDAEALALITRPGFTTAATPGTVSGRGMGMDVVRAAMLGLGGALELQRRSEGGTRIVLVLPQTLAARPALLLRDATGPVAVPLEAVARIELREPEGVTVWVTRADGGEAPVLVEEVLGRREIVVQPLAGPARAAGYAGAALLDDGSIALVLDPADPRG
jgi:two-component system chemotaxis sensor kinase CheA